MSYTANSSDGPTTSGNVTYLLEDEMEDSRTNFNLCYTKISLRIECSFLFQVMCGKIKNVRSESGTRIFSTFSIFFNFLEKCLCGRNSGILSNISCQLLSRFSPPSKILVKNQNLTGYTHFINEESQPRRDPNSTQQRNQTIELNGHMAYSFMKMRYAFMTWEFYSRRTLKNRWPWHHLP